MSNSDILGFYNLNKCSPQKLQDRQALIDRLEALLKTIQADARFELFGSCGLLFELKIFHYIRFLCSEWIGSKAQ